MKIKILIILGILSFVQMVNAQNTDVLAKFTIIALEHDFMTRMNFENQLVAALLEDNYDVVTSYSLLPDISDITDSNLREKLLDQGISIALVLRPLDIGTTATIASVQNYLTPSAYSNIQGFVDDYRGAKFDTQAIIHVAGFLFDTDRSIIFGQGALWLDEPVTSQEQGIENLVELVHFNLNQLRGSLRRYLGLPPLVIQEEK